MVTQMITVKMDRKFLRQIDSTVKENGYKNRTEFIRNALREKIDETKFREAMQRLAPLQGAFKGKKVSYEKVREMAFEEIARRVK